MLCTSKIITSLVLFSLTVPPHGTAGIFFHTGTGIRKGKSHDLLSEGERLLQCLIWTHLIIHLSSFLSRYLLLARIYYTPLFRNRILHDLRIEGQWFTQQAMEVTSETNVGLIQCGFNLKSTDIWPSLPAGWHHFAHIYCWPYSTNTYWWHKFICEALTVKA